MTTAEASGPIKAALGWLEGGSRRDSVDFAKGYATKHFDAPAICWYAVMPFMGGWLWEIQEGGTGRSYLPSVAKALAEGAEQSWFRVGMRAYSISMRDGRPFCVLLPTAESKVLMDGETGRLSAKGQMTHVVNRGTSMLVFGSTIFVTGLIFLSAATGFYTLRQQFVPSERVVDASLLPHRQWSRVQSIPTNLYVESMLLELGGEQWKTAIKPILPPKPVDPQSATAGAQPAVVEPVPAPAQPDQPSAAPALTPEEQRAIVNSGPDLSAPPAGTITAPTALPSPAPIAATSGE